MYKPLLLFPAAENANISLGTVGVNIWWFSGDDTLNGDADVLYISDVLYEFSEDFASKVSKSLY